MCNQVVLHEESDQIGVVGAFGFLYLVTRIHIIYRFGVQEFCSYLTVNALPALAEWARCIDGAYRATSSCVFSPSPGERTGVLSLSLLADGKFSWDQHDVFIARETQSKIFTRL